MLRRLVEQILHPRIDDEKLHQILSQARERLPPPVIWLFGKTQSGKTSLIRALTHRTDAEIGNGFRACTRTARMYPFPDEEFCVVQFLDTRGLAEVGYDPGEDLAWLADQAHLLIVVMKAMDHAQKAVLVPLEKLLKQHPEWPVIVAQTTLHEGYPPGMTRHLEPYPFDQDPLPREIPVDLRQSLLHQRKWFEGRPWNVQFVPLDFTLPEDGFDPVDYGIDALWAAIERALPLGLKSMLLEDPLARREVDDIHFAAAHPQIIAHAVAAGLAAAVPLPAADLAGSLAVVGKLFHSLAGIYRQPLSPRLVTQLVSCLGVGFTLRVVGRTLFKAIPFAGTLVAVASATYMAACTYALGLTLCFYFSRKGKGTVPDNASLQKVYGQAYEEGIRKFRDYLKGASEST